MMPGKAPGGSLPSEVFVHTPVATYVYASDPISQAGVVSQLRQRPEIRIVDAEHLGEAVVAVVVADMLTDEVLRVLRALQRGSVPRTVLVARVIDDATLVAAAGRCRRPAAPRRLHARPLAPDLAEGRRRGG